MDDKKIHKKEEKQIEKISEEIDKEEKTEHKIEQLENRIKDLDGQLKRAIADYRNLERRSAEERFDAVRFANKQLIEALLPAFDTLFLAGKFTQDESVKLTMQRILEVLKDNGIEKVITDNAKYNADTMEAIEVVAGEDGMVVEEVRPGFTINGKLIRPAQVKVGGN